MPQKPQKRTRRKSLEMIKRELFETLSKFDLTLECEDCSNEMGKETTCPFADEIHETVVDIVVCDDCYYNRAEDI